MIHDRCEAIKKTSRRKAEVLVVATTDGGQPAHGTHDTIQHAAAAHITHRTNTHLCFVRVAAVLQLTHFHRESHRCSIVTPTEP